MIEIKKSNNIPKCHISACFLNMPSNCQTECLFAGSYLEIRCPSCLDQIAGLVQSGGLIYKQLISETSFFLVKQKFSHQTLDTLLLSAFTINSITTVQDQENTWSLAEIRYIAQLTLVFLKSNKMLSHINTVYFRLLTLLSLTFLL